jgi:hypothetical protein
VQDSLNCVRSVHVPDPCAEAGVGETIAEAGDCVDDDKDGEGWVAGEDCVGYYVAQWCYYCDAALSELNGGQFGGTIPVLTINAGLPGQCIGKDRYEDEKDLRNCGPWH